MAPNQSVEGLIGILSGSSGGGEGGYRCLSSLRIACTKFWGFIDSKIFTDHHLHVRHSSKYWSCKESSLGGFHSNPGEIWWWLYQSSSLRDGIKSWNIGYILKGNRQDLPKDWISNENTKIVEGKSKVFA